MHKWIKLLIPIRMYIDISYTQKHIVTGNILKKVVCEEGKTPLLRIFYDKKILKSRIFPKLAILFFKTKKEPKIDSFDFFYRYYSATLFSGTKTFTSSNVSSVHWLPEHCFITVALLVRFKPRTFIEGT